MASKHNRASRGLLSQATKIFRRSPSPSALQQLSQVPIQSALSPSPAIVISSANENIVNSASDVDPTSHTNQGPDNTTWKSLGAALRVLHQSVKLLPHLQVAIGTLIPCLDVLEEAAKSRQGYDELASELTSLAGFLTEAIKQSHSVRMSGSIAKIAHSVEEQARLIESKRGRTTGRRILEASMGSELDDHYRRIGTLFRQLQADASLGIWNIVNDQLANTRLEGLNPVQSAYYNSFLSADLARRTCTTSTRAKIISGLDQWSNDPDFGAVRWLTGMAGTGKTTIACSLSELLEERKQLAASFFCTRTVPECREATRIIPTIAYQLARHSIPFQCALCEVLGEDPDARLKYIPEQFERLLKTPLLKVKEAMPEDLVVVVDGLDECKDMNDVEVLLSILLTSGAELPLKFFVASRPEPEIHTKMLGQDQGADNVLHLDEIEKSLVQADIEVYLSEELAFMSPPPTADEIQELTRCSGNLFIYAAALVRYIRSGKRNVDPHKRLQSLLAMTAQHDKVHAPPDGLYLTILHTALDPNDLEDSEVEDARLVLWTVICIQEPVPVHMIAALAGLNDTRRATSALEALSPVVSVIKSSGLVSTLHASFPEFMLDETRSKPFTCNLAEHNNLLTQSCFDIMTAHARFNTNQLGTPLMLNQGVSNQEYNQPEPGVLLYATRYWGVHLRQSTRSDLVGAAAHTMSSAFDDLQKTLNRSKLLPQPSVSVSE